MTKHFKVKKTNNGKYQITGTKGYQLLLDNKYDAVKHCEYLNRNKKLVKKNLQYYTTLKKIGFLCENIQRQSCELGVIQLVIEIKNLIKEML